jgi:hypothetical protein
MKRVRMKTKVTAVAASLLAGGTLFESCGARFGEAIIQGSESFLFDLLNPSSPDFIIDFEQLQDLFIPEGEPDGQTDPASERTE